MSGKYGSSGAADLAEIRMDVAERYLNEKRWLEAKTEVWLADYHLKSAEQMAEEEGVTLPPAYRKRYRTLRRRLRLRDRILGLLGF